VSKRLYSSLISSEQFIAQSPEKVLTD